MNMGDYLKTWNGAISENIYGRVSILFMAFALSVAIVMASSKNERIVLQPLTLTETGWVEESDASRTYKEAVGLSLALLMGNLTPRNLDFVKSRVEPLLSPSVYQSAVLQMEKQSAMIKENRLTYRFEVKGVEYEPDSDKVFVFGDSFVKAATGDEKKKARTFEYILKINGYQPQIKFMDTYDGRPRTEKVLEKIQAQEEREAARSEK